MPCVSPQAYSSRDVSVPPPTQLYLTCLLAVAWNIIRSGFPFVFRSFFCHNSRLIRSFFIFHFLSLETMSYIHLAPTANASSSPTPSSYLHVNSNGGISTVPSSLSANSPSLFGSVGGGKQWTSIGQPSSTSSSSSLLTQQLLMKQQQQHLLSNQVGNPLNSTSTLLSSHFDTILGQTMASALASSSQTQMEKNVRRKTNLILLTVTSIVCLCSSLNYSQMTFLRCHIEVILMIQVHPLLPMFNPCTKVNIRSHRHPIIIRR